MWYRLAIVGSDMPPGGNSSVRPQHTAANRDYLAIGRMSIVTAKRSNNTRLLRRTARAMLQSMMQPLGSPGEQSAGRRTLLTWPFLQFFRLSSLLV